MTYFSCSSYGNYASVKQYPPRDESCHSQDHIYRSSSYSKDDSHLGRSRYSISESEEREMIHIFSEDDRAEEEDDGYRGHHVRSNQMVINPINLKLSSPNVGMQIKPVSPSYVSSNYTATNFNSTTSPNYRQYINPNLNRNSSNPNLSPNSMNHSNPNLNLNTFEAFVQYKDYISFVKAMDAFRGMKLLYIEG